MLKKYLILLTVFIDVLGIGIIIPVMPFFVQEFADSPLVINWLFAVFSACAFFSAPVLGKLSDRFGRRPILLISIFSTAIGWFVFGAAKGLLMLFAGRVIDGLAAGNISAAQSYLADIAKDEKERAANLGLTGAIFGLGLIVGPALGGLLGHLNHRLPFLVVGVLAVFNFLSVWLFLPESHKPEPKPWRWRDIHPLAPLKAAWLNPQLKSFFIGLFLFGAALAAQQSSFALYLDKVFGFAEKEAAWFLTAIGVVLVINQGFLMKKFWLNLFNEVKLSQGMMLVLAGGFLLMSSSWLSLFILGVAALTLAQSVLRVVLNSRLAADSQKRGENLGTMTAVMSLSLIVGPLLAGPLFEFKPAAPFVAAALTSLVAWYFIKK